MSNVLNVPVVSIIVPIYNVERYLRPCLDSLVGQTLSDIEIVCVDDGSTDSSASIIAEYASRDPRVKTISKDNSGYGDSMNRGIAQARGRWIGICEPDDFCDVRMYEQLVSTGERLICDMVKSNYRQHAQENARDDRASEELGWKERLVHVVRPEDEQRDPLYEVFAGFPYGRAIDPHETPTLLYTDPTIWTGVYRRDFLEANGISFSPTPGASFQDASFAHQCWMSAHRVAVLKQGFYHYRIDNAASSVKSGAKVFAVCDEYERSFEFLKQRGEEDFRVFGPRLAILRFGVYVWNYNRIASEFRFAFVDRWIADLVRADDEGLLDYALMTPEYQKLLGEVLEGAESLCRRYPDTIPAPPLK